MNTDPIDAPAVAEDEAARYSEDLISRARAGDFLALRDLAVVVLRNRVFDDPDGEPARSPEITELIEEWASQKVYELVAEHAPGQLSNARAALEAGRGK